MTISVHCEPAADAACALTLVVADGGRGMSAEESMHVFEPYYRSPTHKGGGTGLGARRRPLSMGWWIRPSSSGTVSGVLTRLCTQPRALHL